MSQLPQGTRGRVLALVLVAIVAALFYLLFVHFSFVKPMLSARTQIIELREQELDFRMRAKQYDKVKERLAQVKAFEADNPGFLTEANFDLAASGLIQRLANAVDRRKAGNECQVTSRSPSRERDEELFERVTIKVSMRCEADHLLAVLHELESTSPQLFVSQLNISSRRQTPKAKPTPGQIANYGYIDVRFDLYGYLRNKVEGDD